MLDFDSESYFSFKFEGKEHKLSYAKLSDVEKFEKSSKEESVDESGAIMDCLESLGAPKEVLLKLPVKCLVQLVEEAFGQKK